MVKEKLVKIDDFQYLLPKSARKEMKVNGKIIANEAILKDIDDQTIWQLSNVASLPGIAEPVIALPDVHFGYGLPMGAVAAFNQDGVISAGLCGFDINCGVNSIRTDLMYKDIKDKIPKIINSLFNAIPSGVGSKGKLTLKDNQLDDVLVNGVDWAIQNGYGIKKDAENMEENGKMAGADPGKVSDLAKKRGKKQLGTLGAGNHFLEIQRVGKIYDKDTAKRFGIYSEGQIMIMIHTGSRGLGHQIATDYLKIHEQAAKKYKIWLPDKQLASAPINSKEGQDYFSAMKAAVNYSFTNKLIMTHWLREVFEKEFKQDWENLGMHTVYSIAHNIVKKEKIGNKEYYIHRKGATRSYPGLPVLIAGSMGTASYIAEGTEKALKLSFGSSCHGAGRALSRHQAIKSFDGREIKRELLKKSIIAQSANAQSLAEEAPGAYKNVEDVINTVHNLGISRKVVKLLPVGVIKG